MVSTLPHARHTVCSAVGLVAIIGQSSTGKTTRTIELVLKNTSGDESNGITPDIRVLVSRLCFGNPYQEVFPHAGIYMDVESLLKRVVPHLSRSTVVSIDGHDPDKLLVELYCVILSRDVAQLICSFLPARGADGTMGTLLHQRMPLIMRSTFSRKMVIIFEGVNIRKSEKIRRILSMGRHYGMSLGVMVVDEPNDIPPDIRTQVDHTIYLHKRVFGHHRPVAKIVPVCSCDSHMLVGTRSITELCIE